MVLIMIKKFLIYSFLSCLIVFNLSCESRTRNYDTTCTIVKDNGVIKSVKVKLPRGYSSEDGAITINDRDQIDKLIDSLDSLLIELKEARNQIVVVEPEIQKK